MTSPFPLCMAAYEDSGRRNAEAVIGFAGVARLRGKAMFSLGGKKKPEIRWR